MLQLSHNDKEKVLEMIRYGNIDAAEIGLPNLIDSILLTLKQKNLI